MTPYGIWWDRNNRRDYMSVLKLQPVYINQGVVIKYKCVELSKVSRITHPCHNFIIGIALPCGERVNQSIQQILLWDVITFLCPNTRYNMSVKEPHCEPTIDACRSYIFEQAKRQDTMCCVLNNMEMPRESIAESS